MSRTIGTDGRPAAMEHVAVLDDRRAQHLAHALDHLLRPRAARGDGLDLPPLLALARELHEVVAGGADDVPAAASELVGNAEVEVDREVAGEGQRAAGGD